MPVSYTVVVHDIHNAHQLDLENLLPIFAFDALGTSKVLLRTVVTLCTPRPSVSMYDPAIREVLLTR